MNDIKGNALVVDDYKLICDSIAALVKQSDQVEMVFTAYSGEEAIAILRAKRARLVIVDARMPGMNGMELIIWIRKEYPSIKVIAMTSFDENDTLREIVTMNPDGIILKRSTNGSEISTCIQKVLKGSVYHSLEVVSRLNEVNLMSVKVKFSKRETEIIQLICEGNSAKGIATKLCLSVTTIESYRKELLHKVNVKNTAELITLVHKNGLLEK